MADPDPLDDLRAQVRATRQAAERLMDDAVPPRGWEAVPPEPEPGRSSAFGDEVQALAGVLQAARDLLPPDLGEQVTELLRQLLLVARALIDWLVARMEERERAGGAGAAAAGPAGDRVEDIPIA